MAPMEIWSRSRQGAGRLPPSWLILAVVRLRVLATYSGSSRYPTKFTSWTTARIRSTCWNRPEISRRRLKRHLRRGQRTIRGRLADEPVPYAVRGEEVGRVLRASFQFLPQLQDVVVDCAQTRKVVVIPHLIQEFVARDVPVLVV